MTTNVSQSAMEVVDRLRELVHAAIEPLDPGEVPYALVDFPDHPNVGDSAIWLGEMAAFRNVWGSEPSYVCNFENYDWATLDRVVPDGPIFLHGGGNFGDIWTHHQQFREQLIRRYPERPVIQLPQTIHYDNVAEASRMARLIDDHGAFVLMVRDAESLLFARDNFPCAVQLVPDMAFALGSIARPRKPPVETLMLLRTDKEMTGDLSKVIELPARALLKDWLVDDPLLNLRARTKGWGPALAPVAVLRGQSLQRRAAARYNYLARARVNRGLDLLAMGDRVVTDRLHGHILSTLMGIDHVILDNNYGKIRRFADTWSTDWRGVMRARSVEEALERLGDVMIAASIDKSSA